MLIPDIVFMCGFPVVAGTELMILFSATAPTLLAIVPMTQAAANVLFRKVFI
jgi:hypothetical protein